MRRPVRPQWERKHHRRFLASGGSCLQTTFPVSLKLMSDKLLFPEGTLMDDCDRSVILQRDMVRQKRRARMMLRLLELLIWLAMAGLAAWLLYPIVEEIRNLPDPRQFP